MSSLEKIQGGVEVPKGKEWAKNLAEAVADLDYNYQNQITKIIGDLQKESPQRVEEIARKIADFFEGITHPGENFTNLAEFLSKVKQEIEESKKKKVN